MPQQHKRRKRRRRTSPLRVFILILAALLVLLLGVAVLMTVINLLTPANIREEVTVEAGTASVSPKDFLIEDKGIAPAFASGVTAAQLKQPGSYPVILSYDEKEYEATVIVKDTVRPTGTTTGLTVTGGSRPEPLDFIVETVDVTPVTVTYKTEPNLAASGAQTVTLVLTDTSGNTTELTAVLTVVLDTQAPVITGVEPFVVYLGDAVSYRANIQVADDLDPAPRLNVNSGAVDLSTPGSYTLVYSAVDAAGNTSEISTTVTVLEKKAGYVDLETIYQEADKLIATILKDGMTKREQVTKIYNWVRSNCGYSGHSDKADYRQGAYIMMTQRAGDCFNYFALTKLLFERLGIENIDVRKVKNYDGDSDHFWSLVSLDGGETYYHFDATPRVGSGDDFCLVTDAFLDAYSAQHKNCHNRDKSLYPATPKS